jgi:hypothetical protein
VGGQHHAPAALPPEKTRYSLYRRLGGPQGRSGQVRKISTPPGFDLRTVKPVASRLLLVALVLLLLVVLVLLIVVLLVVLVVLLPPLLLLLLVVVVATIVPLFLRSAPDQSYIHFPRRLALMQGTAKQFYVSDNSACSVDAAAVSCLSLLCILHGHCTHGYSVRLHVFLPRFFMTLFKGRFSFARTSCCAKLYQWSSFVVLILPDHSS